MPNKWSAKQEAGLGDVATINNLKLLTDVSNNDGESSRAKSAKEHRCGRFQLEVSQRATATGRLGVLGVDSGLSG